jgi:NADH:ubiquinone reductase (H+-translocating)
MQIVIIGAGFAGLQLARKLSNKKGINVLLLDKNNYHQFQPLFYQVATAGLDASNISFPIRKVFQNCTNVQFRIASVQSIDSNTNTIHTNIGTFSYNKLVIATGADTNFFGNTLLQQHAWPMKSTTEALQLRHALIENLENALLEKNNPQLLEAYMNIVVVGGGPTGVELSGTLAEQRKKSLQKDYPELNLSNMNIYLVENSEDLLSAMSAKSSEQSKKYLEQLGVIVKTKTMMKHYDGNIAELSSGEKIPCKILIWAAGIKGNIPQGVNEKLIVRGNRIQVNRYNEILNTPNIFAIGDVASMQTPLYANGHPQVANVAINQGAILAKNFIAMQQNQPLQEFEYEDKGSMATVGRHLAVVDIPKPKIHFGGFLAWLVWMGLHLMLILGVKNRIQVLINWMYKYFTYDQSLRLLIKNSYRTNKQ